MSSLFEIDSRISRLLEMDDGRKVDTETGEILYEDDLKELDMERNAKIENCLLMYKNLIAEAGMVGEEIKNMKEREDTLKCRAERIKKYVADSLAGEKFSTPKVQVKWTTSQKVNILNPEELEEAYVRVKVTKEPNKVAISNALKKGEVVFGAELVKTKNISIK